MLYPYTEEGLLTSVDYWRKTAVNYTPGVP
jgi:hypothetical protein